MSVLSGPLGSKGSKGSKGFQGSKGSKGSKGDDVEAADGLLTEALVATRDGIVGAWQEPAGAPAPHAMGEDVNVERWSSDVRGDLFDDALLAPLAFAPSSDAEPWGLLWHRGAVAPAAMSDDLRTSTGGAPQLLFAMSRPGIAHFSNALKWVNWYADLRSERAAEILVQVDDILSFFATVAHLHPDRMRWTWELLGTVLRATVVVERRFKNLMACRRPVELSGQIQPMVQTPAHSSYPSGHATESHAIARILAELVTLRAGTKHAGGPPPDAVVEQLKRLAWRITVNRTVAGLHFPADNAAGGFLGLALGEYFATRMQNAGGKSDVKAASYAFDGGAFTTYRADGEGGEAGSVDDNPDFEIKPLWSVHRGHKPKEKETVVRAYRRTKEAITLAPAGDELLGALWTRAAAEWT